MNSATSGSGKFGASLARVGKAAGVAFLGVGAAATVGLVKSTKAAIDFQASMEQIQTQAGASSKEVKTMSKALLGLAVSVGSTPEDLSKGLYHVESAGFRGAKALSILKLAAEGAAVGHSDLESTTTALVAAQRSGIKGLGDMSHAMGSLNAIVGAGNLRMGDLTAALSTGVLPAAKAFGLSISDVGAAIATLTSNGVPAVNAATGLRMAFIGMAAPTTKAAGLLKSVGLASTDLASTIRQKGLVAAFQELKDKMDKAGLSATQQGALLAGAFGKKSSVALLTLIGNLNDFGRAQQRIMSGSRDFGKAWEQTQHTAEFSLKRMQAALHVLEIQIGSALLPTLAKAAEGFSFFLNDLSKAKGFHAKVDVVLGAVKGIGASVGRVAAEIADGIQARLAAVDWSATGQRIGAAISAGVTLTSAGLDKILSELLTWVNAHSTQIAQAGAVIAIKLVLAITDPTFWAQHWQLAVAVALLTFTKGFSKLAPLLNRLLGDVAGRILLSAPDFVFAIGAVVEAVARAFAKLGPKLSVVAVLAAVTVAREIVRQAGRAAAAGVELGSRIVSGVAAGVKGIVGSVVSAFQALFRWIRGAAGSAQAAALAVGAAITAGVVSGVKGIVGAVSGAIKALWGWIAGAANSARAYAFSIGAGIVGGILAGLAGLASRVAGAIAGQVHGAISGAKGALGIHSPSTVTAKEIGKPLAEGIAYGFILGIRDLPEQVKPAVSAALEKVKAHVEALQQSFADKFGRLSEYALKAFDAGTDRILKTIGTKYDGLRQTVTDGLDKARTAAQKGFDKNTKAIQDNLAALDKEIDLKLNVSLTGIEDWQKQLTPAEKALKDLQDAKDAAGRTEAITSARAQLAAATTPEEAASAQRALDDALYTQKVFDLQQVANIERAARDAAADAQKAAAQNAADAAKAAAEADAAAATQRQQDVLDAMIAGYDALQTAQLAALDKQQANEEKQAQARRDLSRQHLEDELNDLEKFAETHPKKLKKLHEAIAAVFGDFGITAKQSGLDLGTAFAEGMGESLRGVEGAAKKLAAVIAPYLPHSPAKKGPLSKLPNWEHYLTAGLDESVATVNAAMTGLVGVNLPSASVGAAPAAMGGFTATSPAGGPGVTVNVYGSVTSERDLTETIRQQLLATGRANGTIWGPYA